MKNNFYALKIYTRHGFVKENIFPGKKVLDVGCGQRKLPGALGMDIIRDSHTDIVHDTNRIPWPLKDNEFDVVFMNHLLEHVVDVPAVLGEAHRIGKPGARVIIQVPYFRCVDAFDDPTHRHLFTARSMDYFFGGTQLSEYKYVPFMFRKVGFWYGWPHEPRNPVRRFLKQLIHKYPHLYDQYFSLLFPVKCLTWEVEIIK